MNVLSTEKSKSNKEKTENDKSNIIRFNKPKGTEIILGIIFTILCINSLYGLNNLFSNNVRVGNGYIVFNLIIIAFSAYFAFRMLLRDKLGYVKLEKDYIGINKLIKEKKINHKDIKKIVKLLRKDKLICYRVITKEEIFDIPMEYYKEEEIHKINAYLKSKGKL